MDNRSDFQKIKTKFSIAFFLFGNREWHKNADMVHAHSSFVAQCNQDIIKNQESIFNPSGISTDALDKPFRFDVGSN